MRDRNEILKDLVSLERSVDVLEKELWQYPWDIDTPLLKISNDDFNSVLKKCINNEIDFETLTNWANAIECREDIDVDEKMQEIIFELASPEINGEITIERLHEIINELKD